MAKRAGIARAMALDPPLLFLDEPSAGLDPITSAGLDKLIKDIARDTGTTFVVVTHELQSILAIGDRCIMLDKDAQGMIAEGDPRAAARRERPAHRARLLPARGRLRWRRPGRSLYLRVGALVVVGAGARGRLRPVPDLRHAAAASR